MQMLSDPRIFRKGMCYAMKDAHLNYIKLGQAGRRALVVLELTSNSKFLSMIVMPI